MKARIPALFILLVVCMSILVFSDAQAQLKMSKTSIAFGSIVAQTSKTDSFYVKNDSTAALSVTGMTLNTAHYAVVGNTSFTINGGDSVWVKVTFTPASVGSFPDTLKIANDAVSTANPLKVVLSGSGTDQLTVSKTSMAFGAVLATQTKVDSFEVENKFTSAISLTSVTTGTAFFTITGNQTASIAAGAKEKFYVTFAPNAVADFKDTVVVAHAGVNTSASFNIPVSGSGTAKITFTRTSGTAITTLSITDGYAGIERYDTALVKNESGASINITAATVNHPDYTVVATFPITVENGASGTIPLVYMGAGAGRADAILSVVHNSTIQNSSPVDLKISARSLIGFNFRISSTGALLDTHVVRVNATTTAGTTPGNLNPAVPIDSNQAMTFYLTNIIGHILTVDSLKFQTPHFYVETPAPFYMRSSGNNDVYQALLRMRYKPKDLSNPTHKDTLYVYSNDTTLGGRIAKIAVEGKSREVTYILSESPLNSNNIDFGTVPVGSFKDIRIRVYNYQTTPLVIDSLVLKSNHAMYSIGTPTKVTLGQGDTSFIPVRFSALDTILAAGSAFDSVMVYVGANTTPVYIKLAGKTSLSLTFVPSATTINFGDVNIAASKDTIIWLYNYTKDAVVVDSITLFSGLDYLVLSNTAQQTINSKDSIGIQVRFDPTLGGILRDTLYLYHQAPTTVLASPRKTVLQGNSTTQGVLLPSNYSTVDNVGGIDGVAITSPDSSYSEVGQFWTNTSGFGGTHRRSPNLSGSNNGSASTWTFTVDESAPYLVYHYVLNSPNVGGNNFVRFSKFGIGGVYDSARYNQFENRTLLPGYAGTWKPLMMHIFDGVGFGSAKLTIGADERSGGFLRNDAVRALRSRQVRDIEFGRRDINFGAIRVPEEFPEVTLGDEVVYSYRLYNLGSDTLTITDIKFFSTNNLPVPRFFVKNTTFPVKIPPLAYSGVGIAEKDGYHDLQLAFAPFEEEIVRDSMIIYSNDDTEPEAYTILHGTGINYYFIMNASLGGTEPHFRAPMPGPNNTITTMPLYIEGALGAWANSTLAGVTYPIPGGNLSSRVNVGGATTLPHYCTYEFELPDLALGTIPTDGRYILEYGGPSGSPNGYSMTEVIVSQTFGTPADTGYFSGVTLATHLWAQIGGSTKTFFMSPGGKISVKYERNAATTALGGTGFVRADLLRVRKVPTGALIGVSVAAPDSLNFGEVNFRNPAGIDGKANKKSINIGSRGESSLTLQSVRLLNGQHFRLLNTPPVNYQMKAINGDYTLNLEFNPNEIAPLYKDTIEIRSNTTRLLDSVIIIPIAGIGVGATYIVNDDDVPDALSRPVTGSDPLISGLFLGSWDNTKLNNWQRDVFTENARGLGTTRLMLPIRFNDTKWFEWYPAIDQVQGEPDSVYVNVILTLGSGLTKVSPAARVKVFSTGGNITLDTVINQNGRALGPRGVAEINLGNHWFLRGGRDAKGGAVVFGKVRVENDVAAVTAFYGNPTNVAISDTFALVADAVIIRELSTPKIPVGVAEEEELPREFALSQNYPNPFNPVTNINFSLPEAVTVELKVYDLLGREVRTLINGESLNPGYHTIRWDGRNDYGTSVSSGVYFYRIVAGGFVKAKKMMMLK